jgi:YidC/Oxa1 family membrane protein insertase
LYYLIANVISIGQMYAIKAWFIDEQKLRQRIDENKAAPKKKSAFAERLERMQQEQQRKTKEIREARDQRKSRR